MVDERKKYQVFSYVCEQKKVEQQNLKAQVDDQWIDSVQERTRNSGSFQWNLYQFSVEHILSPLQAIDMQCLDTDQEQKY